MNEANRQHGLQILERYCKEQDGIESLLQQIDECKKSADTQALQDMLSLCVTELKQRQKTLQDAFRFLLNLEEC